MSNFVSEWVRQAAKGQDCMLRLEGICNNNTETTVYAHSNNPKHGKGLGIKADDTAGFFACGVCHEFFDLKLGKDVQEGLRQKANAELVEWVRCVAESGKRHEAARAKEWLRAYEARKGD